MGHIKVNNKRIIIFFIASIFNMFLLLSSIFINQLSFDIWLLYFFIIITLQLIFNCYFLVLCDEDFFSLSVLFLIFSYIFHFGQIIVILLKVPNSMPVNVMNLFSNDIYKNACQYALFIQCFVILGMIITRITKDKIIIKKTNYISLDLLSKISLSLIYIGIIPKLYIEISKIILYINGNYASTYNIGVPGFIDTIGRMAEIGIIGLLISKQNNKKFATKLILFITFYETIIMLTGNRSRPMVFLVAIYYIYFQLVKKIKLKNVLLYGIIIYIGLAFINIISDFRNLGFEAIKNLNQNLIIYAFKRNPLFDMLGEFGGTLLSLCVPIQYDSFIPAQYGKYGILSLLTIIPNIGGILDNIVNKMPYINYYRSLFSYSYGGSYIGEIFFNFRSYGITLAFFVGIFIGQISKKIKYSIKYGNYDKLLIYMVLFPNILWWVRDYFSSMVREVIWAAILISILKYLFLSLKISNNYSSIQDQDS